MRDCKKWRVCDGLFFNDGAVFCGAKGTKGPLWPFGSQRWLSGVERAGNFRVL